jgi:hypothetical protein
LVFAKQLSPPVQLFATLTATFNKLLSFCYIERICNIASINSTNMKKALLTGSVLILMFSCQNEVPKDESAITSTRDTIQAVSTDEKKIAYPLEASFASDWKIGKPENAVTILQLYKFLVSDLPTDSSLRYFADSITSISYDDKVFRGSNRDFLKRVSDFRQQFKSLDEELLSVVSLYSPSRDVEQVCLWIKERGIRQNGKKDSTVYQENWRFDKTGKINYRSAYARYSF